MKKISLILIGILCLGLLLTGCGNQDNKAAGDKPSSPASEAKSDTQPKSDAQPKTEPLKITMAGYSAGGVASAIGEAIGEAVRKDNPGSIYNYEPGKGGGNEIKVNKGDTEIGLSSSVLVRPALEGKDPYTEPLKNINALAYIFSNEMLIISDKRSGINTLEDFKTKPVRIANNTKNSMMELGARAYLNSIGSSYEEIEKRGGKVYFGNATQRSEMIRNRQIDIIVEVSPTPTSPWIELSTTVDLQLIPLGKAEIEKVQKDAGFPSYVIPAKIYPFYEKDYDTYSVDNIIIASKDMSEETAYNIVKAMYNHLTDLQKIGYMKALTPEKMPQVGKGVPLHPGAAKFYKEKGLLK